MTEAKKEKPIFYAEPNQNSRIKHCLAVMSGKGGVGKSLVTGLVACAMQRAGRNAAIMDADITGPSIPREFGLEGGIEVRGELGYPRRSATGIQIVSTNLILENETDPVIWKGPMVGQAIKQFWTDFVYEDVDYLFVDMPPGTGDVPLTVFQTLPIDGVIVVTSPQDLVAMIVEKAVNMAKMMNVPILGVVENMSYFKAPDTGKVYPIFGESHIEEVCAKMGIDFLTRLPIDPEVGAIVDQGRIEEVELEEMSPVVEKILGLEVK